MYYLSCKWESYFFLIHNVINSKTLRIDRIIVIRNRGESTYSPFRVQVTVDLQEFKDAQLQTALHRYLSLLVLLLLFPIRAIIIKTSCLAVTLSALTQLLLLTI